MTAKSPQPQWHQVPTITEPPSDEVKAEPPPNSDTIALNILPDSTFTDHDTSSPGAELEAAGGELHPVIRIVREKELGKTVIALAVPIATAIVTAGKENLAPSETSFILTLVCVGLTAIFNGILLEETFPKFAQIVEPVGIILVATAFFAIVTFFVPVQISWIPALCSILCLLPFLTALRQQHLHRPLN